MRRLAIQTSRSFSSFKHQVLLAATLVYLLSATIPADAGLLMDIAPNSAAPGTSGTLEVTLTNTGTGNLDLIVVGGFSFEITAAGTDVTFSDVTTATSLYTYIFPGSDSLSESLFGPGSLVPMITNNGQTISASDNFNGSAGKTLTPGETVSLGLVSYSISSSAPIGVIPITFTSADVSDSSGVDIPVVLSTSGNINVVPEPSSLISMLLGSVGIGIGVYRRRNLAV